MLVAAVVVALWSLVWLTMARAERLTGLVLGALTLWAAGMTALAAVFPRMAMEAGLLLFLGAAAIVTAGSAVQRRRLGAEAPRVRWPFRVLTALTLCWVFVCTPGAVHVFNGEGFVPSVERLGPLPADLTLTEDQGNGLRCGSGTCAAWFTVQGRPGEPADRAVGRLRQHLVDRGWPLDGDGQGCRPVGWLLDQRTMCVRVGVRSASGEARIVLEGARAWA